MPAVSLLEELISGIEPIFVTPLDRRQSKHPISSTRRLKQGGRSAAGGMAQAFPEDVGAIRSGYDSADRQQASPGKQEN